jgi:uncharacterized membrane protein
MIKTILILAGITLLPFLELRASIPYGILQTDLHWSVIFMICVITNAILGPIIYFLLDKVLHIVLRIKFLNRIYHHYVEKMQNKIHKGVEKYGEWCIAIFVGIPLPGSGSYSGALAAYLMGLSYKKFIIANLIGVIIAGIAVTAVVLTGDNLAHYFVKSL